MQKTFISATFGRVMYSLSFVLLSVSKIKEKLWVAFCEIFVSCEPEKSELKLGSDQEHKSLSKSQVVSMSTADMPVAY